MELRGYDHYEVTLGDEIRGERASMGKSIADVERDLRIRRDLLLAIENCDLSGVANPSLLPGYVRSYARYLGMDVEEFYARFCAGSGFVPPRLALDAGAGGGAAPGPSASGWPARPSTSRASRCRRRRPGSRRASRSGRWSPRRGCWC